MTRLLALFIATLPDIKNSLRDITFYKAVILDSFLKTSLHILLTKSLILQLSKRRIRQIDACLLPNQLAKFRS